LFIKNKGNKMGKLEEYQAKKIELEQKLEQVNRDIIITEQSISQQQEIFQQQFGTTDIEALQTISKQYQDAIAAKEQELALLEQEVV
jgi:hypothetical protein